MKKKYYFIFVAIYLNCQAFVYETILDIVWNHLSFLVEVVFAFAPLNFWINLLTVFWFIPAHLLGLGLGIYGLRKKELKTKYFVLYLCSFLVFFFLSLPHIMTMMSQ